MLRWGILGASNVAATAAAPALREAGHDLAIVGSRSRSRAQQFAAGQGVRRARGSYEDVVAADDVDCVYVGLPNALHEQWAVAALEAGKHVLCEKPMATSAAAARRMGAAAASSGRMLMEARWLRVHPRTEALLTMVREGELGTVRAVTASSGSLCRHASDFRLDAALGGGALLDRGGDQLAVSRWLLGGSPDAVSGISRRSATGVDLATTAGLGFAGAATAALHAALDVAGLDELVVTGSRGTVRLPDAFGLTGDRPLSLERDDGTALRFAGDGHRRLVEAFTAAVDNGREAVLSIDDAVATAEALDRVRAAIP